MMPRKNSSYATSAYIRVRRTSSRIGVPSSIASVPQVRSVDITGPWRIGGAADPVPHHEAARVREHDAHLVRPRPAGEQLLDAGEEYREQNLKQDQAAEQARLALVIGTRRVGVCPTAADHPQHQDRPCRDECERLQVDAIEARECVAAETADDRSDPRSDPDDRRDQRELAASRSRARARAAQVSVCDRCENSQWFHASTRTAPRP